MLNSKKIIPIKPGHYHGKVSSVTMILKMFTALVLISSNGAKHFLVKTKGLFTFNQIQTKNLNLLILSDGADYSNSHTGMRRTKESGADYSDSQKIKMETLYAEPFKKVYPEGVIEGKPVPGETGPWSRSAMIPDKPGKKKSGRFRPISMSRNTGSGRGRRHSKSLKQGKSEEEIYPGFALIG